MAQNVNLSVAGIYTSMNDMNGLPPGALNVARNVVSRYKNLLEPRRGFEGLPDSAILLVNLIRLINFPIGGVERIVALTDEGDMLYYVGGVNPWLSVPGDFSSGIIPPNAVNGKSRFLRAGQNLYLTSQDGVRSLASASGSETLRAGVPKGLNLEAVTNGDTQGFFNNNIALTTTGDISVSSALITNLASTTGILIGQYVTGVEVQASKTIQDLKYTSELFGALGNGISIQYIGDGTAGSETVSVVGNAIVVHMDPTPSTGSTATQIKTAIEGSSPASGLVSIEVSGTGTNVQSVQSATLLENGLDNTIPLGTKIASITPESPVLIQAGDTQAGLTQIINVNSDAGIVPGILVSGEGIPDGTKVVSVSGAGPFSVEISQASFKDQTGVDFTFTSPIEVTMSASALATRASMPISFYTGSQVSYRMVFGRVETDLNGGTITRLGAPSSQTIVNNTSPYSTNVIVRGTLPKNSEKEITFVQLYRSQQTESVDISPLDQYALVYERALTPSDFSDRVVTITDSVPDSLRGIPLYAGSDQEGILQANNPPPMCWDMCAFRDFALYGNITQPSSLRFTIVSVGAPDGLQLNDEITVSGSFLGTPFSQTYIAKAVENLTNREFQVFDSGTPSQNIADTANSLIRVINYDEDLPVHAILLSTAVDLPGQILLEADDPSLDTFQVTANLHRSAYDPELNNVVSKVNTVRHGIAVSKAGEMQAVPATNVLYAGDSSSEVLRVIPLRDYVIVLKSDGVYKIQGLSPDGLVVSPFDLTTKIIGADTAVSLNSGVWMLSNQGVVSIDDGGVNAKSIPIDDQLNLRIGSYGDNLANVSFAIGYESDRQYLLCVPNTDNPYAETEYVFNYVTNSWTTWDRRIRAGFVHSVEGKFYISRADGEENGISRERKTATYRDFVDESIDVTVVNVISNTVVELDNVSNVEAGDAFYQSASVFSPIDAVDPVTKQITLKFALDWQLVPSQVLQAYECEITWKQVFGDNPAFVRQFSEGLALFKNTRFLQAQMRFATDFSPNSEGTEILGIGNGLWGLFSWGTIPWGGANFPSGIRFYIPQDKQLGSYILPTLFNKQAYSDFKCQGLSISYSNVSQEVGK